MKFNPKVSHDRSKARKAHFDPSNFNRRKRMASTLSKPLRSLYSFRSFPVVTGDEVIVRSGEFKGKSGKVLAVKRREYKVYVDGCAKVINGKSVNIGIAASKLQITKLDETNGRKVILEKKKNAFIKKKEEIKKRDAEITA
ncbi:hypothetical protein GVAV_002667 [Gurleya vavrai]